MGDLLGDVKAKAMKSELLKQARAVVRLEGKAKLLRRQLAETEADLRTARKFLRDLAEPLPEPAASSCEDIDPEAEE